MSAHQFRSKEDALLTGLSMPQQELARRMLKEVESENLNLEKWQLGRVAAILNQCIVEATELARSESEKEREP